MSRCPRRNHSAALKATDLGRHQERKITFGFDAVAYRCTRRIGLTDLKHVEIIFRNS
jgi:hypothetical protein